MTTELQLLQRVGQTFCSANRLERFALTTGSVRLSSVSSIGSTNCELTHMTTVMSRYRVRGWGERCPRNLRELYPDQ
eukprot:142811-Prymnesium_polylepis.1